MSDMIAAVVGVMAGQGAIAALTRWIGLIYFAATQTRGADGRIDKRRAVVLATCQSLFHAGPWSVATALFVAYHIRTESWAPWLFGGFLVGFVLMGGVMLQLALRLRASKNDQGKANAV